MLRNIHVNLIEIKPTTFTIENRNFQIFDNLIVKMSTYSQPTIALDLVIGVTLLPGCIKLKYSGRNNMGKFVYEGNFEPICLVGIQYHIIHILFPPSHYKSGIEMSTSPHHVEHSIAYKMFTNTIVNINNNDIYDSGFFQSGDCNKLVYRPPWYEPLYGPFFIKNNVPISAAL